jgi:hypothetical protein
MYPVGKMHILCMLQQLVGVVTILFQIVNTQKMDKKKRKMSSLYVVQPKSSRNLNAARKPLSTVVDLYVSRAVPFMNQSAKWRCAVLNCVLFLCISLTSC